MRVEAYGCQKCKYLLQWYPSLRSRRLEVVGERENGRARGRPFFLVPTTSKRLLRRLMIPSISSYPWSLLWEISHTFKHYAEQQSAISFWFLTSKHFTLSLSSTYQHAQTEVGDCKEFASPLIYRLNSHTSVGLRASYDPRAFSFSHLPPAPPPPRHTSRELAKQTKYDNELTSEIL